MKLFMGETTGHINAWGDDWRATAPPQDPSRFETEYSFSKADVHFIALSPVPEVKFKIRSPSSRMIKVSERVASSTALPKPNVGRVEGE